MFADDKFPDMQDASAHGSVSCTAAQIFRVSLAIGSSSAASRVRPSERVSLHEACTP
jgi:hypothetical protein